MAAPKMRSEEEGMSAAEMRMKTTSELRRVPRGGLPQNQYRMALQLFLMNSMGGRPQIDRSTAAAHAAALRTVRESYPGFEPTILQD